jgi:hypothetical protein
MLEKYLFGATNIHKWPSGVVWGTKDGESVVLRRDLAITWEGMELVVGEMRARGWFFTLGVWPYHGSSVDGKPFCYAEFRDGKVDGKSHMERGVPEFAPMTAARAALKVLDVEVPDVA